MFNQNVPIFDLDLNNSSSTYYIYLLSNQIRRLAAALTGSMKCSIFLLSIHSSFVIKVSIVNSLTKFDINFVYFNILGDYGDELPAEQIIPNALEVLDALEAMLYKASTLGYF